MKTTLRVRRGTAATWAAANPVLKYAEPGLETDTNKLKFGDGVTAWNALPYFAVGPVGPPGAPGPAVLGNQGRAGRDSWVPGPQGSQGLGGAPGAPGTPGATGPQGSPGLDGRVGRDSWVPGAPGPQGVGVPGPQGNPGLDGRTGRDSWVPGAPGIPGSTGSPGPAPVGTGYVHVTNGVLDSAVLSISESDVTNLVADLASAKSRPLPLVLSDPASLIGQLPEDHLFSLLLTAQG